MITSFPTCDVAGRTSLVPSRTKAEQDKSEPKGDQQDKPGTAKKENIQSFDQ